MPAELDAIYDDVTAARLRRTDRRRGRVPASRSSNADAWRRRAVAGGLLTGLTLGLREVFEPPPDDDEIVHEVDIDAPPLEERAVRFVLVDGAPRASRIIVRPWLAPA